MINIITTSSLKKDTATYTVTSFDLCFGTATVLEGQLKPKHKKEREYTSCLYAIRETAPASWHLVAKVRGEGIDINLYLEFVSSAK